jgi:glycosyltransferase involved in cell wall biosynthesis
MGKAGRRHVEDKYAWSACLDRMEDVYESVV